MYHGKMGMIAGRGAAFAGLVAVLAIGVAGCGSKSGTVGSVATPSTTRITRATENNFSLDARIIAARESSTGWISADVAAQVDADLQKIRAAYPALANYHALPEVDPNTILVTVKSGTAWLAKWQAGTLTTGVSALDALSTNYQAAQVKEVPAFSGDVVFRLSFANPMATKFVASAYKEAASDILSAEVNNTAGDGDNITRTVAGQTRVYSVSAGWNDCPAGCINRHTWAVTLQSGDIMELKESGSPLPK